MKVEVMLFGVSPPWRFIPAAEVIRPANVAILPKTV